MNVAERSPDRTALVHNRRTMTYAELIARARAVAGHLGRSPGVVGVAASHTPATVTALLGVWLAGGCYCPIDPTFPAPRRALMARAAGCRTILAAGPAAVPPVPPELSLVDQSSSAVDDPAAPAYTIFTSGSTGQPRPVTVPAGAVATSVTALRDLFGLGPADRVLQFASLNWDTCFEEILPALVTGACLVLDDDAHTGSFQRFLRVVARHRVTVLDLPTAYWHELVRFLAETRTGLPGELRLVVIGGEPVSPVRLADWRRLDTGRVRLLNTYGCTETVLVTHAVDLHGPLAPAGSQQWGVTAPVPIGRALPHVRQHIGADGELMVAGPALALGYHGMPAATAARFTLRRDGDGQRRYFRTGDRVGRLPGGWLTHEGRLDDEVKVRGIRVDPAEVEARIGDHPAVRAVAVVGVTVADHTALHAYVVPHPAADAGATALELDLLADLRDRMPAHLVPSRLRVVGELAYTASGKLDRAASHRRYAGQHRVEEALR